MYDRVLTSESPAPAPAPETVELTFAVSGKLWNQSLVMIDQQSRSEWSHQLGRCMEGQYEGRELSIVPSVMTDWRSWRESHPDTTVVKLERSTQAYVRGVYQRNGLVQYVLGLALAADANAWPLDWLDKLAVPIHHDFVGDRPVLITWQQDSLTARAFYRDLPSGTVTFVWQGDTLRDKATGSRWEIATGRCVEGQMAGKSLKKAPAIISLRPAWKIFRPNSLWADGSQR